MAEIRLVTVYWFGTIVTLSPRFSAVFLVMGPIQDLATARNSPEVLPYFLKILLLP